jgi:uncharacterized membrane protein YkvA (DUF1232 family)
MENLRRWARSIKRDVVALYFAGRDARVPWYAKAVAVAVAAYALSPIDLIPDSFQFWAVSLDALVHRHSVAPGRETRWLGL